MTKTSTSCTSGIPATFYTFSSLNKARQLLNLFVRSFGISSSSCSGALRKKSPSPSFPRHKFSCIFMASASNENIKLLLFLWRELVAFFSGFGLGFRTVECEIWEASSCLDFKRSKIDFWSPENSESTSSGSEISRTLGPPKLFWMMISERELMESGTPAN